MASFGTTRRLPSGRWQARYIGPDGLRRSAPQTFGRKKDAQDWLAEKRTEIVRGDWLDPDRGRVRLSSYGSRWIKERTLADTTRSLYESLFRLHVVPYLGGVHVGLVSTEIVRSWLAALADDGRSAETRAKAYRLLRAVMATAVEDGRAKRNPCRIKGADRAPTAERPVATVVQVFALAEAVGEHWRVFVLTGAFAHLRWGELVALRRRDIDLAHGLVSVWRTFVEVDGRLRAKPTTKTGKPRVVTVPPILIEELRTHLDARVAPGAMALVFTGERGATPRRGNWRDNVDWKAAVDTAGLPAGFHFHDLRHTGNHLIAQAGASTRELMQRMGHSTMRAALIYQHATEARDRALADRLDDFIRAQRAAATDHLKEG